MQSPVTYQKVAAALWYLKEAYPDAVHETVYATVRGGLLSAAQDGKDLEVADGDTLAAYYGLLDWASTRTPSMPTPQIPFKCC